MNRILRLFTKATLLSFCVVLFASCLGDSSGSWTATNELVYIKRDSKGVKYAFSERYLTHLGFFITGPVINELEVGEFYNVGYNVSSKSSELTTIDGKYDAYYTSDLWLPNGTVPLTQTYFRMDGSFIESVLPFTTIPSVRFAITEEEALDDRWVFDTRYKRAKNETVKLMAFYNKDAQKEKDSNNDELDLEPGQVIIDLRLEKEIDSESSDDELVEEQKFSAVDFSDIRYHLADLFVTKTSGGDGSAQPKEEYLELKVKFRYNTLDKNGKEEFLTTGSWITNSYAFREFVK